MEERDLINHLIGLVSLFFTKEIITRQISRIKTKNERRALNGDKNGDHRNCTFLGLKKDHHYCIAVVVRCGRRRFLPKGPSS